MVDILQICMVVSGKLFQFVLFYFSVAKFANEQIAPLVPKMDAECYIDKKVYKGMFENGVSAA